MRTLHLLTTTAPPHILHLLHRSRNVHQAFPAVLLCASLQRAGLPRTRVRRHGHGHRLWHWQYRSRSLPVPPAVLAMGPRGRSQRKVHQASRFLLCKCRHKFVFGRGNSVSPDQGPVGPTYADPTAHRSLRTIRPWWTVRTFTSERRRTLNRSRHHHSTPRPC